MAPRPSSSNQRCNKLRTSEDNAAGSPPNNAPAARSSRVNRPVADKYGDGSAASNTYDNATDGRGNPATASDGNSLYANATARNRPASATVNGVSSCTHRSNRDGARSRAATIRFPIVNANASTSACTNAASSDNDRLPCSGIELLGYVICRLCPEPVIREVAARTGGLCSTCFAGGRGPNMRRIEVVGRGYRIRVPLRKPQRTRIKVRDQHHHQAAKAKHRAHKRLKAIFPDLYDTLVAEERAAAGLEPWPTEAAVRYHWDPDSTQSMRFAEIYHALDRNTP